MDFYHQALNFLINSNIFSDGGMINLIYRNNHAVLPLIPICACHGLFLF